MTDGPKKRPNRSLKPRQPGDPYTVAEVADVLCVSVDTAALLRRNGAPKQVARDDLQLK
jgi:hypothetical protein